ncbi:unnamed protein product [Notodromas monacha]|uniref:DUF885 domain-containing protein n=1 Tax=Notodromas monacha TaxID=399045 RepID=A0A7R9G990_9CRUS|nr:unnamed protein product [Notodromas monacha]CAG0913987.1 unnamed protein product [Notodromas monacha]
MASAELSKLFGDFWDWRMKEFPEFAYLIGWKGTDHYGKLQSYSQSAFESRKEVCTDYIAKAENLAKDLSHPDDILNCKLFVAELNEYNSNLKYKGYVFPVSYLDGIQVELATVVNEWMAYDSAENYKALLETFRSAVPKQANEIIDLMNAGISCGMVSHAESVKGAVQQFDSLLNEDADTHSLLEPLAKFPTSVSEAEKNQLTADIKQALKNNALPALKKLRDFIADTYSQHTRKDVGVSTLPNGKDFYAQCLHFHTSTNLTPEEIHEIGLAEVKKDEEKMLEIIKKLGSADDIKAFSEKLRTSEKYFAKSKKELLDKFRSLCDEIEPLIPKLFNFNPPKVVLKEHPPAAAAGPAAEYIAGTPDGSRPGVFFVNTNNFSHQPTYEMISLALHEANPGHHLQACFLLSKPTMPAFRQYVEDRKYCDPPSRFPFHTAYIEGWGLYSETLGHDFNLYNDPMDEFGHLSEDVFRACRLVVDTGLHAFGWSKEKAVQFMLDHTAASQDNVEKEIRRYITWPGQACAYKIGQLKLLELRRKASDALGSAFDLREFHDVVLNYFGPLELVEEGVDGYVKSKKSN